MEILNILMAFAALVLPFLVAWVIVSRQPHLPKHERKSKK